MFDKKELLFLKHPLVGEVCFRIALPKPKDNGVKYETVDENIADILSANDAFEIKTEHTGNIVELYIDHHISSDKGYIWVYIDVFMSIVDAASSELTEEFLLQILSAFEKYYSKKFSLSIEKSGKITCVTFTEIN